MDDPDVGWHLRTGEEIVNRGEVPKIDWYTHTYVDFPWIDHEWATDVTMYAIYSVGGPFLLSVISCLLVLLIFLYLMPLAAGSKLPWQANLLIGTVGAIVSGFFVGVRPQILGMLGVVLVLVILRQIKLKPDSKIVFWLPILFLVWVNLHGSFVLGLGVVLIVLLMEWVKRRTLENVGETWVAAEKDTMTREALRRLTIVFPVSLVAVLINPYGYRIFEEVGRTMFDTYGTREINEWMAPDISEQYGIAFAIYLFFWLTVFFFRRGKIGLTQLTLSLLALLGALMSRRNIPIFVILTLPYLYQGGRDFFANFLFPILRNRVVLIGLLVMAVVLIFFQGDFWSTLRRSLDEQEGFIGNDYPVAAVDELRENPISGNIFNEYNWGGYLIWRLPDVRVFTDGRTPHWREDGIPLLREFQDTIQYQAQAPEILEKYDISYVLLSPERSLVNVLREKEDWEEVYEDEVAVILKKRETNHE